MSWLILTRGYSLHIHQTTTLRAHHSCTYSLSLSASHSLLSNLLGCKVKSSCQHSTESLLQLLVSLQLYSGWMCGCCILLKASALHSQIRTPENQKCPSEFWADVWGWSLVIKFHSNVNQCSYSCLFLTYSMHMRWVKTVCPVISSSDCHNILMSDKYTKVRKPVKSETATQHDIVQISLIFTFMEKMHWFMWTLTCLLE